jgi:hypothetical protein
VSDSKRTFVVVVAALVVGLAVAGGFTGVIAAQNDQSNYDPTTPDISFIALCSDSSLGETTATPVYTQISGGEYKLWQVDYTATGTVDYIVMKWGTTTKRFEPVDDSGTVSVFDQGTEVNANGCDPGDDEDKYERVGEPPNSELVLETDS